VSAAIVYRFHPFFDRQITVLRRIRQGDHPAVIVRVIPQDSQPESEDSELRINVPCWMMDSAACGKVQLSDQPRIDVDALCKLRRLVDQFFKASSNAKGSSGPMMAKGDRHETRSTTQGTHRNTAPEATNA
jgi:hypothetical protein